MDWQTYVITGASSGIGKCLALSLARQGKRVFGLARGAEQLNQLEKEGNGNITGMQVDVSDAKQIAAAFEEIEKSTPIDVLVNNAAIYEKRLLWDQDLDTIDNMININLKGSIYCARLVVPYMLERKRGYIVNICSMSGKRGHKKETIYCATKHGMVGFADSLAQDLQPFGIHVTTICPGGTSTPLWDEQKNPYPGDKSKITKPEEIAELVEFILSRPDNTVYKRIELFPMVEWH